MPVGSAGRGLVKCVAEGVVCTLVGSSILSQFPQSHQVAPPWGYTEKLL